MSAWSSIVGSVWLKQTDHISIKKLIQEVDFDEVNFDIRQQNLHEDWKLIDLYITYSLENESAAKLAKEFADKLKEHNLRFDLEVKIRWLS